MLIAVNTYLKAKRIEVHKKGLTKIERLKPYLLSK